MHTLAVTGFRPDPFAPPDLGARPQPLSVTAMPSGTTSVEAPDEERADVAAAAAGDRRAFERLYRTHGQRIFALCLRMTADRQVAEELVQDVFVRAWQKLDGFRGDAAFGTWLHRVAVNIVLSRRKRDGVQRDRTTDDDASLDAAPARPVHVGDRLDLEAAIAALPPGARRIFYLHDVEGYTHEEIGDLLGITSGGSKAQLHRARLLLREALTR
ncbi:MAG TPA: RNA polymerase sigma factor [Gemmatimonadaceae bacterium]|nr:RNA polymerase sigma factor [Gemmatimonadaceae bacterium]